MKITVELRLNIILNMHRSLNDPCKIPSKINAKTLKIFI